MFQELSLLALLQKGGITVVVLALLSVLSIAITLERAWAFRRFSRALDESTKTIRDTVGSGGLKALEGFCRAKASPLAEVLLSGITRAARGKEAVSEAMEIAGRREVLRLERFLGVLGTIGSTAPFIGLFGTVLGIIRAFSDLALSQGASPAAVADGIAEALIATAAGLFVAVPAVVAYNYFVRTTARCALELEAAASEFTDTINGGAG